MLTADDFATLTAILTIYALVVMSPGPNFIVVTRYALNGAGKAAFIATVGVAAGATVNASITMFGAGALIVRYPWFGVVVAVVGGSVLIFLGLQAAYGMVRQMRARLAGGGTLAGPRDDPTAGADEPPEPAASGVLGPFMKGFWVNLLNPKGIAFFLGLYAPLIAQSDLALKLTVLTVCFGIELIWYGLIILFFVRPAIRGLYARSATLFDALMGGILVFLGLRIMMDIPVYIERMHG